MYRCSAWFALLLLLGSCHKAQPLHASHATHANEPPDIAWFDGSLDGAFIVAKRENRPVLIYWGAEWCPFCHTLKSTVFSRPSYQNGVASTVGSSRGFPDLSMSAAVNGAALVYLSAAAAQGSAGYYLIGGTSEASPEFSGIIAIADQMAGHGLGLINPALYSMEAAGAPGIVDVTHGTNTVTFPQNGATHTVHGWSAVSGYDLSTGVGTVNAALFIPELVHAVH